MESDLLHKNGDEQVLGGQDEGGPRQNAVSPHRFGDANHRAETHESGHNANGGTELAAEKIAKQNSTGACR
jgi:hypothetical protein